MSRYDLLRGRTTFVPVPKKKCILEEIPRHRREQSRKHFLSNLRIVNKLSGAYVSLTGDAEFNHSVLSNVQGPEVNISIAFHCPISNVEWMMTGTNLILVNSINGQELPIGNISIATNLLVKEATVSINLTCRPEESKRFLSAAPGKYLSPCDVQEKDLEQWQKIDKAMNNY